MREQANRTFDIFVSRIRKYGSTLPDTILPPPNTTTINGTTPRMGTPQNDTSWAGWAISSFTNKMSTASGDIEARPNTATSHVSQEPRVSSGPSVRSVELPRAPASPMSDLHRQALSKPTAPTIMRTTTDSFFQDAQVEDDEIDEAWGDMGEDSFFDAPATQTVTTPTVFDDGGEPDFAGWLSAQAQAKSKTPLPKGLSRPLASTVSNGRPVLPRGSSTGSLSTGPVTKKLATSTAKTIVPKPKAINVKPADSNDDDWGEAWD